MDGRDFERIYFECNIRPMFERVLREAIERTTNKNGREEYARKISTTRNNSNYKNLKPPQSDNDFNEELNSRIEFVNKKMQNNDGSTSQFFIYRVFENKRPKEKIGYITFNKNIEPNGDIVILNIEIFRDDEHFVNTGGVSVLKELEKLIRDYLQNPKIKLIQFTCSKENTSMDKKYKKEFIDSGKYCCIKSVNKPQLNYYDIYNLKNPNGKKLFNSYKN